MQVKDFCTIRVGYSFRSRVVDDPEGTTRIVQPKNISSDGTINFNGSVPLKTQVIPRSPLKKGEVLVLNKGRFAAAVFNMPGNEIWVTTASVMVFTLTTQKVIPEYISLYLNSTKGQRKLSSLQELSSIPFVKRKNIEILDIPVPSISKQKKLVEMNRAISKYAELTHKKTEILKNLMNSELEI